MSKHTLLAVSLCLSLSACATSGTPARAPSGIVVAPADSPAALVEALPNERAPEQHRLTRVERTERERDAVRAPRPRPLPR